jgi:hypothetical protein
MPPHPGERLHREHEIRAAIALQPRRQAKRSYPRRAEICSAFRHFQDYEGGSVPFYPLNNVGTNVFCIKSVTVPARSDDFVQ